MTKQQKVIRELIDTIESSVNGFDKSIPGIQDNLLQEILLLAKDLELRNNKIVGSVSNLKTLAKIKSRIDKLIGTSEYKSSLKEYIASFNSVTDLQNQYFSLLSKKFKPNKLLDEIKSQAVTSTLESLTEKGIGVNVVDKIGDILRINITSGAKYTDMVNQLRDYIVTNEKGAGVLQRYTKQITTDALNQYSAQYTNVVTSDLGLEWFMYDGSLIRTSRDFCEALIAKKYIHKSELPTIVKGDFKQFKDLSGKISSKTGLPEGMIDGTTAENFHVYRGGYNCGHQLIPVDEAVVPKQKRVELYFKIGAKYDEAGFKVAA